MKSVCKRIVSALLVVAMAATTILIAPSIDAEAASMSYNKTETIYLNCKDSDLAYGQGTITVKNASGKIYSVKSTDESIVYESYHSSKKIHLIGVKAGKATISFKIKGKSKRYKCTVTVKKYSNPVGTLKVTGVNSSKNTASKFKKTNEVFLSLKSNKSDAKLTVKAADGWKLTSVEYTKGSKTKTKTYNTTKKKTIKLGSLKKSKAYAYIITFKNKKTGAKRDVTLYVNYSDE